MSGMLVKEIEIEKEESINIMPKGERVFRINETSSQGTHGLIPQRKKEEEEEKEFFFLLLLSLPPVQG